MSRPYSSRMGRAALEDGPAEVEMVRCPDGCDDGVLPVSAFDPRPDRECDRCLGEGEIPVDELDDEP